MPIYYAMHIFEYTDTNSCIYYNKLHTYLQQHTYYKNVHIYLQQIAHRADG